MDGDMIGANQTRKGLRHGCKPDESGNNTCDKAKGKNEKAKGMSGFAAPLFLIFALCLLPCHFALAEALPDPTRPPAEAGLGQAGEVAAVASGPVLQSIKIAPGHKIAVINGQQLTEGESFGEAKLLSIGESEVTLQGPEGQQTLKLFPGVEKRVALAPQGLVLRPVHNKTKRNIEQKAP